MTPEALPPTFPPSAAAARLKSLAASISGAPTETLTVTVVRFDPASAKQIASDLDAIATVVAAIPAPTGAAA